MRKLSTATISNHKKLNKTMTKTTRANKTFSTKTLVPLEYYSNEKNVLVINEIIDRIKDNEIEKSINSLIISFLRNKGFIKNQNNVWTFYNDNIKKLFDIVSKNYDSKLLNCSIPLDERDPIGIIYQQLMSEGEKNEKGSYYTPEEIVKYLLGRKRNKTYCDPCCGTGSFCITALSVFPPQKIYGYDLDEIAINIARCNMLIRHPEIDYVSHFKVGNFLLINSDIKFECIITNPPWCKTLDKYPKSKITSKEMFSYFIEKSIELLDEQAELSLLLPVAISNVDVHKDIRKIILDNFKIKEIKCFGKCFKGVLTDVISIKMNKLKAKKYSYKVIHKDGNLSNTSIALVQNHYANNLLLVSQEDENIIKKMLFNKKYTLEKAIFALGIVTGDNESLIYNKNVKDSEPIYTGKEIKRYTLEKTNKYIIFNKDSFQQCCNEKYFRTNPKIVYKFISNKLCFAIDYSGSLFLNSANMLILPDTYSLNYETVLAILNSKLMNFFFEKYVGQIKVLKKDIQKLPLPEVSNDIQNRLKSILNEKKNNFEQEIDNIVYEIFNLSINEIQYLEGKNNANIE